LAGRQQKIAARRDARSEKMPQHFFFASFCLSPSPVGDSEEENQHTNLIMKKKKKKKGNYSRLLERMQ
jgi:hypothetical protein